MQTPISTDAPGRTRRFSRAADNFDFATSSGSAAWRPLREHHRYRPWPIPLVLDRHRALVMPGQQGEPGGHVGWSGGGVYHGSGRPDIFCLPYMHGPRRTLPPPERTLPDGVFCGMLRRSFPHFVAESIGRLWAVTGDARAGRPLVYITTHRHSGSARTLLDAYLAALGLSRQIIVVDGPTRFDRLAVPVDLLPGMSGHGTHPAYRRWLAARRVPVPSPVGPRLYVSRSGLGSGAGGLLGEAAIEAGLVAEGYEIFHPQRYPLDVQMAAYANAGDLVVAETGALHLIALLAPPTAKVAVIRRRPVVLAGIQSAMQSFPTAGQRQLLNAIVAVHAEPMGKGFSMSDMLAELDFPLLWQRLQAAGMIAAAAGKPVPSAAEIAAEVAMRAGPRTARVTATGPGQVPTEPA